MTVSEFASTAQAWTLVIMTLLGIVQALIAWALWSVRKAFVTTKQCEANRAGCQKTIGDKIAKQEATAVALHDKVSNSTPKEEAAALATQVEVVRGTINTLRATVEGLSELLIRAERQLGLLMEHHLRGGKA